MSDEIPAGTPLLSIDCLRCAYSRSVQALHGVSLDVTTGSVMAVLGSNGAGKTTLLRAISGTLPLHNGTIDSGSIRLDGRELNDLDPAEIVRAGVVQVPEGRQVFTDLTVEENLRAGALVVHDRSAQTAARERVYDLFPILAERRKQHAGLMSGGEQQMLAIGRALMAGPRLLLLDEPSLGLAPLIVDQIGEVVREINRQGTTVVLVEQNAGMSLRISDDACVLEVGDLTLSGSAAELSNSTEVRARYLGVRDKTAGPSQDPTAGQPRPRGESGHGGELIVDELSMSFAGVHALKKVSFRVEPGSIHALIGPNGAGKSTCINAISGIYRATGGSVRYAGTELTRRTVHRIAALGVSRTFQNISLSLDETVLDNILMARHLQSKSGILASGLRLPRARRERRQDEAAVREVAALLDLTGHLDSTVSALSYGVRKRIELARALCTRPGLLLLDEPVAGMNREESDTMAQVIGNVQRELGISILMVEHDMTFVMGMADRVTVLDFGSVIADGLPSEVQQHPDVLRAYLGAHAQGGAA